jgi:hypothetical protein
MQRSYVAKTTVNFPDFELYVRLGDILVYDAAHGNTLTVYRGGSIVKSIKTTPLSVAAMVKTKMLEETTNKAPASKQANAAPQKPAAAPKPKPQPKVESKPKSVEKELQEVADAVGVSVDQIHKLPPAPPTEEK